MTLGLFFQVLELLVLYTLFQSLISLVIVRIAYNRFKKAKPSPFSKHEPDELIEHWQEGFLIGLVTLFKKKLSEIDFNSRAYEFKLIELHREISIANSLNVIQEMKLKIVIARKSIEDPNQYIRIKNIETGNDYFPNREYFQQKENATND